MADQVRMTALSVFQNERITVFREGGPEAGETGVPVTVGDAFETDRWHAGDLDRAGLAEPVDRADLDGEPAPLKPHFQVSAMALAADTTARAEGADPVAAVDAATGVRRTRRLV